MRRELAAAGLALALALWAPRAAAEALVYRARLAGPIQPAAADYIHDSLRRAADDGASALVLEVDTPGGLLSSTQEIVKDLLGAKVPVLSYVAPGGAGAASAGVFVVMAAHVAAMAPGTTIGASTPVLAGGGDLKGDLAAKVKSFTAAFAKSIAERRGRNVAWAERAVQEAVSATDREALELGVVDLVAGDLDSLLRFASGRVVSLDGERRTLELEGARVVTLEMGFRRRVLGLLANPTVAYFLLLAGLLGVYLELSHPGGIVPGIVGALCLLIAAGSFQVLPINVAGLLLLLLGLGLLVAELFLPSFGVVGAGGLVAFVLGSLYLFDEAEAGVAVDRRLIGGAAAAVGFLMLLVATLVVRAMRARPAVGREALLGAEGEVRTRLEPRGTVWVEGEIWRATTTGEPIEVGERVRVVAVEGLTLRVERAPRERSSS